MFEDSENGMEAFEDMIGDDFRDFGSEDDFDFEDLQDDVELDEKLGGHVVSREYIDLV